MLCIGKNSNNTGFLYEILAGKTGNQHQKVHVSETIHFLIKQFAFFREREGVVGLLLNSCGIQVGAKTK